MAAEPLSSHQELGSRSRLGQKWIAWQLARIQGNTKVQATGFCLTG